MSTLDAAMEDTDEPLVQVEYSESNDDSAQLAQVRADDPPVSGSRAETTKELKMRTNTRTGLIALAIAAPLVLAATIFSNAPAQSGQSLLSPGFLLAQSDTTEEDGMMGQGGMDGMMEQGEMGQGGMGGMMNMMQQMQGMMEDCNEMMQAMMEEGPDHQRPGGGDTENQQQ